MWKSIGDKFEIEPHNEQKHPRKIRTNVFVLVILILAFIVTRSVFREKAIAWIGSTEVYNSIIMIVYALCIIATILLFLMKYIKNKHEVDIGLVVLFCILVFINILWL